MHRPVFDSRPRESGFTLLELLVAMVIAGVLIGIVSLSIGGFDRSLRFEAERLAQLLVLAREEAQVRAAPIRCSRWRPRCAACCRPASR